MIVNSLYSLLLSCFSSLGNSLRLVGSALSDRDVITSPDCYDIITAQIKNVQAQTFRKLGAWLQVNNREGLLYKTWCTVCLLTANEQCTITPVRRNMGAMNYISDILYKIHGPAKYFTLSVSHKWGIIQVTILSSVSMLGKELSHIWNFMFAYYDAIICLCLHYYSYIHSCCLCVLLTDWILKWINHIPCDVSPGSHTVDCVRCQKWHVNMFDWYNDSLERCGCEVHHQKSCRWSVYVRLT